MRGFVPHVAAAALLVMFPKDSEIQTLQRRIETLAARRQVLRSRLQAMESMPFVIKAPFEVRDHQGHTVIRVQDAVKGEGARGLYVLNEAGNVSAQATVYVSSGGSVAASSGQASFGGDNNKFIAMFYDDTTGASLQTTSIGEIRNSVTSSGFEVAGSNGNLLAAIGLDGRHMGGMSLGKATGERIVAASAVDRNGRRGTVTVAGIATPMPTLPSVALFSRTPNFIRGVKGK